MGTPPSHGHPSLLWGTSSVSGTLLAVGTHPCHGDNFQHGDHGYLGDPSLPWGTPSLPWGSPSASGTLPATEISPGTPSGTAPPGVSSRSPPARPVGSPVSPPGGTDPGTHPFSSRLCRAGGDHRSRPTGSGAARRRDEPSCRRSLCGAGAPIPPAPPVPPVPPVLPVPTVPPAGAAGLGGGGERGWGWPGAGRPRRDRGRALGSTGRSHVSARTVLTVYALLGREVAAGDGLHRDGSAAG